MPNFTKYFSDIISNLVNSPNDGGHQYSSELATSSSDTDVLLNPPNDQISAGKNTVPRSKKGCSKPSKSSHRTSSPTSCYTAGPTRLCWDSENSIPPGPNPFKSKFDCEYDLSTAPLLRAGHAPETPQRQARPRLEQNQHSPNQSDALESHQTTLNDSLGSNTSDPSSPGYNSGLALTADTSTPPFSRPTSPLPTPTPGKYLGLGISGISPEGSPNNTSRSFDGLGRVGVKISNRRHTIPRPREVPAKWRNCIIGGFEDVEEEESDFAVFQEEDDELFPISFSPPPPVRRHFLRGYEGDLYDPMGSLAYDYNSPPEISDAFYEELVNTWTLGEESFLNHVLDSIPEEEYDDFEEVDLQSSDDILGNMSPNVLAHKFQPSESLQAARLLPQDKAMEKPFLPITPLKGQVSLLEDVKPSMDTLSGSVTCVDQEQAKSSITLIKLDIELDDFHVDLGISS